MLKTMGFCNFDTTKNRKVEGNDVGEVHVILKRKYRQYMNRKGGFNRPLDFVAQHHYSNVMQEQIHNVPLLFFVSVFYHIYFSFVTSDDNDKVMDDRITTMVRIEEIMMMMLTLLASLPGHKRIFSSFRVDYFPSSFDFYFVYRYFL